MARASGLLGERQRISNAKGFKRAKESLGVKSVTAVNEAMNRAPVRCGN
jgi:hypothetical protein